MNEKELLDKIMNLHTKYGRAIYNHKEQNIPELDDLYYELITKLSISNLSQAMYYTAFFDGTFSLPLKIRLTDYLLDHNGSMDLLNLIHLSNENLTGEMLEQVKNIYQKMLTLSDSGKFDIDNYYDRLHLYNMTDQFHMLKNKENVKKIMTDYSWLLHNLDQLFEYLIQEKYQFTMQDTDLINYIITSKDFNLFANKCFFDKEVFNYLLKKIDAEHLGYNYIITLLERYPDYTNDLEINITINNNEEEFLQMISSIKNSNIKYKLVIPTINVEFLNKIKMIVGDRALVSPSRNAVGSSFYSIDEALEINSKIDVLAKALNDHDGKSLSPLEKYMAAYIIVTNFGIYKTEKKYPEESRSVYEIMRPENEGAIVCVGYVKLLRELLERNGMGECICEHGVSARTEKGYSSSVTNHHRAFIRIKDDKYGVDGFYMCDPTWDSIKKYDVAGKKKFAHLLLTYEGALKEKDEFPRGIYDLNINSLTDTSNVLGANVKEYFHNEVDEDTLIKALCGVNRFVSKNGMSMSETVNIGEDGYTIDEYNRAAVQLGKFDKIIIDEKLKAMPLNDLIKHLIDEYGMKETDLNIVVNNFIVDMVNNKLTTEIIGNKFELQYTYFFYDTNGKLKYSEEDIEKIYNALGVNVSLFPYLGYKIADIDMSSSLDDLIALYHDNAFDLDSKIEEGFNAIIAKDTVVK